MRKKRLEARMARLLAKKNSLDARCKASTDVNEVRELTEQLDDINADIADVQAEIAECEEEERAAAQADTAEKRSAPPAGASVVNPVSVTGTVVSSTQTPDARSVDPYSTMEYRKAFMEYAQRGTPIPADLVKRDGIPANTDNLGATIPTTILNEFINEIRVRYGNLYNKVRKLNIKGNLRVPIAQLQAHFKWVTESTVAPRESAGNIENYVKSA